MRMERCGVQPREIERLHRASGVAHIMSSLCLVE